MGKAFDFDEEFGAPKKLLCKNFNKIQISIHPDFSGIYLCYQEAFKALKTDLGILNPSPEIHVWKDTNLSGYTIASNFQWFLYWTQNAPKEINLIIHSLPKDNKKIELLKNVVSSEFLKFLSSTYHDLNRLNPKRLHNLINEYISAEAIYKLNKENSFKPHRTMSLDLLADLLSCTRNQLNHRNKVIHQKRQKALDRLEQTSEVIQQLLNNPDFVLTPDQLWKA
ncbi:hypothetical protein [Acinetobacter sp. ANC 5600]|uniref:hypothetical protein n=1 Tax=Acinetobacter sp. ANC 5600 TaxID=1960940 RepID=UPI0009941F8E|nr:hypothetical protein [Acinetobacter sp. ANC 5600]OOV79691.1 hypothetical protein B1201_15300 [Acinetobacter sp. ANC 5600]